MMTTNNNADDELTIFRRNLRYLRKQRDLIQGEIAQKVGISRAAYVSLENNKKSRRNPSIRSLLTISRFFNIPVGRLLDEDIQQSDNQPTRMSQLAGMIHTYAYDTHISQIKWIKELYDLEVRVRTSEDAMLSYGIIGVRCPDTIVLSKEHCGIFIASFYDLHPQTLDDLCSKPVTAYYQFIPFEGLNFVALRRR